MEHFGVILRPSKYGLKLNRENYAIINNKSSFEKGKCYDDAYCQGHLEDCLKNYDLNMQFFASLNHDQFNNEINSFLEKNDKFEEVYDLKQYKNVKGYYLMILDEYCQVYVGTTKDIKDRIQRHWSGRTPFDRLIFGWAETSKLSIDSFRALDTTRIYAYKTDLVYDDEDGFVSYFSPKFVANRTAGGKLTDYEAISKGKYRKLQADMPDNPMEIFIKKMQDFLK